MIMMKKAGMKDLSKIYKIILDCSMWLKNKGVKQWNPPYPKKLFRKDVKNGNVYYFLKNEEILGTVTLLKNKPHYYPEDLWNDKNSAQYICRLAVPRKLKNTGIGKKLLIVIKSKAKKQSVRKLRLDVIKSNPFLFDYYLKLGFKKIHEYKIFDTPSIFMEKEIK